MARKKKAKTIQIFSDKKSFLLLLLLAALVIILFVFQSSWL